MPSSFISRARSWVEAARIAARSAALGSAVCPKAPALAPKSSKPIRKDVLATVCLPRLFSWRSVSLDKPRYWVQRIKAGPRPAKTKTGDQSAAPDPDLFFAKLNHDDA